MKNSGGTGSIFTVSICLKYVFYPTYLDDNHARLVNYEMQSLTELKGKRLIEST